jgi:hypothetical protein
MKVGISPLPGEELQKLVADVSNLSPALLDKVRAAYSAGKTIDGMCATADWSRERSGVASARHSKNLDVVLCDERLDRGMIVIIDAIDVDEVVGEAPGNDGQMQARVLRSDVAKRVGNVTRTDHDGAGRGRHLLPPMVISNSPSRT